MVIGEMIASTCESKRNLYICSIIIYSTHITMISDSISSYIYTGDFLKDLHHPVTTIVWEKMPDTMSFPTDVQHFTLSLIHISEPTRPY